MGVYVFQQPLRAFQWEREKRLDCTKKISCLPYGQTSIEAKVKQRKSKFGENTNFFDHFLKKKRSLWKVAVCTHSLEPLLVGRSSLGCHRHPYN